MHAYGSILSARMAKPGLGEEARAMMRRWQCSSFQQFDNWSWRWWLIQSSISFSLSVIWLKCSSWCDKYSTYIIYQVATWSDQMIRSPAPCIHSHCSIPLERMDDFYLSWYNWFLFAFVFSSWSIIMLICKINGLNGFPLLYLDWIANIQIEEGRFQKISCLTFIRP